MKLTHCLFLLIFFSFKSLFALPSQTQSDSFNDLVILSNGKKLYGELVKLPKLNFPFGMIVLSRDDIEKITFFYTDSTQKMQVDTRDGLSFMTTPPNEPLLFYEETNERGIPEIKQFLEINLEEIDQIFVKHSTPFYPSKNRNVFQMEMKSGDIIPIYILQENLELSMGWKEFSLDVDDVISLVFDGGIHGLVKTPNGKVRELEFAYLKNPLLHIQIANSTHTIRMPWRSIQKIDLKDEHLISQQITQNYQKIDQTVLPESTPSKELEHLRRTNKFLHKKKNVLLSQIELYEQMIARLKNIQSTLVSYIELEGIEVNLIGKTLNSEIEKFNQELSKQNILFEEYQQLQQHYDLEVQKTLNLEQQLDEAYMEIDTLHYVAQNREMEVLTRNKTLEENASDLSDYIQTLEVDKNQIENNQKTLEEKIQQAYKTIEEKESLIYQLFEENDRKDLKLQEFADQNAKLADVLTKEKNHFQNLEQELFLAKERLKKEETLLLHALSQNEQLQRIINEQADQMAKNVDREEETMRMKKALIALQSELTQTQDFAKELEVVLANTCHDLTIKQEQLEELTLKKEKDHEEFQREEEFLKDQILAAQKKNNELITKLQTLSKNQGNREEKLLEKITFLEQEKEDLSRERDNLIADLTTEHKKFLSQQNLTRELNNDLEKYRDVLNSIENSRIALNKTRHQQPHLRRTERTEDILSEDSIRDVHIVAEGENLNNISMKFYGTPTRWPDIYEANRDVIKDVNRIQTGTTLIIPE